MSTEQEKNIKDLILARINRACKDWMFTSFLKEFVQKNNLELWVKKEQYIYNYQ